LGRTPKTIYRKKAEVEQTLEQDFELSVSQQEFLQKEFLQINEIGEIIDGIQAFSRWCYQRKLPVKKTVIEFIETKNKYETYYNGNFIDGTSKLKNTNEFSQIWIQKLFYKDFYTIECFGKTRLGTLLHYAKQGQSKLLMLRLVEEIQSDIHLFLMNYEIDAIAFVPPTIRREVQLMKFLETYLKINRPKLVIQKISGIIPVPQKSLNKMDERIRNADNTFAITDSSKYNRVLLIDDAVGSGATINQIAAKMIQKGSAKEVYGLAIVGSF
jgi:predicted amidophosphoribosyltransferase